MGIKQTWLKEEMLWKTSAEMLNIEKKIKYLPKTFELQLR